MTDTRAITGNNSQACANCGTALSGDYCAQCGQSRHEIRRAFLPLVTDALDGLFQWDGRLLVTIKTLFSQPGKVARSYMDGKRQSFTPPLRLYLIVSLIFFAMIGLSGVRIVAVNLTADDAGEAGLFITLFQPPREGAPVILSPEVQQGMLDQAEAQGVSRSFREVAIRAMNEPGAVEEQAASAASQAMILMVLVFAVLCGIFHPRRRIIEHVVHALYFHAVLLIPLALVMITGILVPLPGWGPLVLAISAALALIVAFVLFDRGFYQSSWIGAGLRIIPIVLGYVLGALFVSIGLILWAAV
ncbi:MAG: hypothetical protein DHS20C06_12410 [Hyphobacterium sp.]|nr:MAG: hypothetical protein DHS20C06_12410 [Hyphobacterium sp.]